MTIGDDISAGDRIARFIASGGLDQALARAETTLADAAIALEELKMVVLRAQDTVKLVKDGLK